ncbi:hypothetical protein [Kushneria marisflavi]|uniref:hypothetical protein n=1 Tax=Kushneria marisflavi TaxID=157779 RepID=UPI0011C399B9|nr:hypothetical protein [Kushneria marisflavi]
MASNRSYPLPEIPDDGKTPEGYLPLPIYISYATPRWPEAKITEDPTLDDCALSYTKSLKWWPQERLGLFQRLKKGMRCFARRK